MTTILAFLGVLAGLILVHELGHFLTAKAFRVKVLEFGFGFPPRLLGFRRRPAVVSLEARLAAFRRDETVYTLNGLPLGGFVRLTGEESLELRLLVQCASEAEFSRIEQALSQGQASLDQQHLRGRITLLGLEVGPVTQEEVQQARKARGEVLALGVEVEPQARAQAQRSRTRITLAPASLEPGEAVRQFIAGYAAELPRALVSKGVFSRAVILASGSLMNFLLPLAIFSALFMVPREAVEGQVLVLGVAPDSPAARAGLRIGDAIVRVDGHPIPNHAELAYRIRLKLGQDSRWEVARGAWRITEALEGGRQTLAPSPAGAPTTRHMVTMVSRWKPPAGEGSAGVVIATADARAVSQSYPFWQAVPRSVGRLVETLVLFRNEIISMFIGQQKAQVAGVVGIAQLTGEVVKVGFGPTLELLALLSLNLGILNLLPIPALDGGRLLFVAIEWIRRGKRIPPEREALVHLVGFALLLSLMAVISYFDILRLLRGESLLR